MGDSVYDNSHNKSRGYGIISDSAPPGENGIAKWKVDWEGGKRKKAISQKYLERPHIDHRHRVGPTAIGQRIVPMVGQYKGTEGTTVQKVGK